MRLILFLLCFNIYSCSQRLHNKVYSNKIILIESQLKPHEVTFTELMKNSKIYEDSLISLEGYFALYFEDVALYSSFGAKSQKAVWLSFDRTIQDRKQEIDKLKDKKIKVVGYFSREMKGHLDSYFGSLYRINSIEY